MNIIEVQKKREKKLPKYILIGLILLLSLAKNSYATPITVNDAACHPKINPALRQYIVGYGSLMSEKSKLLTNKNVGINVPILIKGFQRGWFAPSKQLGPSTTYLGVMVNSQTTLNAILFQVKKTNAITTYDEREIGYCRALVDRKNIRVLTSQKIYDGQLWIYIMAKKNRYFPSKQYPIVQSYVDLFLSGCLELQEKYHLNNFAKQCVQTTSNWSINWVNDRVYPRRPFYSQPWAAQVDKLLVNEIPKYFNAIKIE